jgi:para-aminobenzoate synthetase component 1
VTLLRQGPAVASAPHIERLPGLDGVAPMDAAERLRDLPGLTLLEAGRPGRRARWSYLVADPLAVIDSPTPGVDPFATARAMLGRLASDRVPGDRLASQHRSGALPEFTGGLVGFLGYELRTALERLSVSAPDDQGLPTMRLGLHDWTVSFDRVSGQAWLAGRACDGDVGRLERRLADVSLRLARSRAPTAGDRAPERFVSRPGRDGFLAGVERIRSAIAHGDLYQANLTRRLEAPFAGDPWPLYRCLRTGDPALFAAYHDLGPAADGSPRAILSASPEPFLAVTPDGHVQTDPIKGTRPRGANRTEDRALARELLASAKDRAENVMIVDVLRNDLGRVCRPGSVRVPRLCRLERTATVQHLVSTVTGRLESGRDGFDVLRAAFPGGSITGAPKIRAMEILDELEPVRRGPYTGTLGWFGADGGMATSILIRTFVADGRRLTLHVGGGITWRSDPAAEWDETVAKARGPLGSIGAHEDVAGAAS